MSPPFRIVVRYEGYKGWWWHIEDDDGRVVNFIGTAVDDLTLPDGVVLRGRALTRWGARQKAASALSEVQSYVPPEDGWKSNRSESVDGRRWTSPGRVAER